MLVKSLQFLAEDVSSSQDISANYVKIVSAVLRTSFNASSRHNINEQIQTLLLQLGWKNTQIKLKSADAVEMIFGSNRYLEQTLENKKGLELFVKTLSVAMGNHILGRDCDALVTFNDNDNSYRIDIQATKAMELDMKAEVKTSAKSIGITETKEAKKEETRVVTNINANAYDTTQIILPILNNRLPLLKLQSLLKDVCEEFSRSWYQNVPELSSNTDEGNLAILLSFIIQKSTESGNDIINIGKQIGSYYADAIVATFPNEQAVTQEIIDGSAAGSIIRDIKARSLCSLTNTQSCGPSIGGSDRRFCDLSMGIWSGTLEKLTSKTYTFTTFFEAGKRDPYCLMEFNVI